MDMPVLPQTPSVALFGATALELDVLLALCLHADGVGLPTTRDGRLDRAAFARDVDPEVLVARENGARVRERKGAHIDADGAPSALVYQSLVLMGLAQDSQGLCAWIPTAAGRRLADGL